MFLLSPLRDVNSASHFNSGVNFTYINYLMDKFIALLCLVSIASACLNLNKVVPARVLDTSLDLNALRMSEITMHNNKRALHRAGPLAIDTDLNTAAQAYAEHLALNDLFAHSSQAQSGTYGQNLFKGWGSPTYTYSLDASTNWYNEVQYYNYVTGGSNDLGKAVGHFTAMVWKASTKVGFGFAKVSDSSGQSFYVVANYSPTPNVVGQYQENVNTPT